MKTCESEMLEVATDRKILPSGSGEQDDRRPAQLMRINEQMFETTFRVLAQQIAALLAENTTLRREGCVGRY